MEQNLALLSVAESGTKIIRLLVMKDSIWTTHDHKHSWKFRMKVTVTKLRFGLKLSYNDSDIYFTSPYWLTFGWTCSA